MNLAAVRGNRSRKQETCRVGPAANHPLLVDQTSREQRSKLLILALVRLLLPMVLLRVGVLNALDSLSFIQQYDTGTLNAALPRFDLGRFGALGLVSAAWFLWNAIMQIRDRSDSEPERSTT